MDKILNALVGAGGAVIVGVILWKLIFYISKAIKGVISKYNHKNKVKEVNKYISVKNFAEAIKLLQELLKNELLTGSNHTVLDMIFNVYKESGTADVNFKEIRKQYDEILDYKERRIAEINEKDGTINEVKNLLLFIKERFRIEFIPLLPPPAP